MRLGALMNTVGRNKALGNARQYNILVFAPHIKGEIRKQNDKTDPESDQIIEFLSSLLLQDTTEASCHDDLGTPRPAGPGSHGFLQSRCFEILATSRNDWSKSIQDYCSFSRPAIEALEQGHLEEISTWLATSSSAILLIDVVDEQPGPSWTTDLVLEMVDVFETANSGSRLNFGALVTHLCRTENSRNYGEEGVLRGILAQIIEANPEIFKNPSDYEHVGLTEEKLCSAECRSEELWEMIVKCLKVARIRILVIILDHIEEIFLQGRNRFQRFVEELNHRIGDLCTDHGVIVKTMVTCRLEEAAFYFYEVKASIIAMRSPSRRRFRT
ncbi:hypothetical protein F5B21DRAFT_354069 [Xylaria acuta]|nr:hypothetical protein F5B21DRAFT_354069 [Xylaria acuta]